MSSYLVGSDSSRWQQDVPHYASVRYRDLYQGIDLVFHTTQDQLEYDFVVAPGADPDQVALAFDGHRRLSIDGNGDLIVDTAAGQLRHERPVVYQEDEAQGRTTVPGSYRLDDGMIRFRLGRYDHSRPLVIDPVLRFSSFLGGTGDDAATGVAVDGAGSSYVIGTTASLDFPTTPGTRSRTMSSEVFVSKVSPDGSKEYTTYLGGDGDDSGRAVAVDANGSAYVTGNTNSANFPTRSASGSPGPYQQTKPGPSSSFVAKLDPAGTSLAYSTYLGGTDGDSEGRGLAVDGAGGALVVGWTKATNFPTVNGLVVQSDVQPVKIGNRAISDAFVTKVNAAGTALAYSTYLGGYDTDEANGVTMVGGVGYVTGSTMAANFPTTSDAAYPTQPKPCPNNPGFSSGCPHLAFVAALDATKSGRDSLVYSSYLGGADTDRPYVSGEDVIGKAIAVDPEGAIYVAGSSLAPDLATSATGPQATKSVGSDAFLAKVIRSADPMRRGMFQTYLGGAGDDSATGVLVGSTIHRDVTLFGTTTDPVGGTPFPTTTNAIRQDYGGGGSDAFITRIRTVTQTFGPSPLPYSTYLGGSGDDLGAGIARSADGDLRLVGATTSADFPVSAPVQGPQGGSDAFYARLAIATPVIDSVEGSTSGTISNPAPGTDRTPTIVVSGVVEGDTVQINDGANPVGSKVTPAGATTVVINASEADNDVTLAAQDGNHRLTATAYPAATSASSAEFVYNLDTTVPSDTTPPNTPNIASIEGDTSSPAAGNDATPTIVVSDVVSGDTVRLFDDGLAVSEMVVPTGATVAIFNAGESDTDATLAPNGDHPLTAVATDPVGNASPASPVFLYRLTTSSPDTIPPPTPRITAVEGDTSSPAGGGDTTPAVIVSGLEADDRVLLRDGGLATAAKVVPTGATTVTFNASEADSEVTLSPDGDHHLTATATDPAGNVSAASAVFVYTLTTGAGGTAPTTTDPRSGPPTMSISDTAVTEGDTATTPAVFTLSLSAASDQPVTVRYATSDVTARTPADYHAGAGSVSFAAGQTATTLRVEVNGDKDTEANEAFAVNLITAVGATIDDGQGIGSILNDDKVTVGYWLVAADGGIFAFGDAAFRGSTGAIRLNQPIVGMAATPSGNGYWLAARDGGIFAFGDAVFRGSTGAIRLNQPIVGMASTPSGRGYWLVASDGGIFAFGDATFRGSTGAIRLNQPIVGMASTPSGQGYWLVARDGGIFAFGDAAFHGSTGAIRLNQPIVAMAATPTGNGYRFVASDGGIFTFGDARFRGSAGATRLAEPIVALAGTVSGEGYWLAARDGGIYAFGDAAFRGSAGATRLAQPIVGMAQFAR